MRKRVIIVLLILLFMTTQISLSGCTSAKIFDQAHSSEVNDSISEKLVGQWVSEQLAEPDGTERTIWLVNFYSDGTMEIQKFGASSALMQSFDFHLEARWKESSLHDRPTIIVTPKEFDSDKETLFDAMHDREVCEYYVSLIDRETITLESTTAVNDRPFNVLRSSSYYKNGSSKFNDIGDAYDAWISGLID